MSFEKYIVPFQKTYACYASNEQNRAIAASGGVVTTLMAHLLKTGAIDGAALCRSSFTGGKLGYEFAIVKKPEEVFNYASSVYYDIPIHKHLNEIKHFSGKLAICALPCHIALFDRIRRKGKLSNISLLVSLFCGHNASPELLRFVMKSHGIDEVDVKNLFFRRTYLRGNLEFTMKDGSYKKIPFWQFNVYRSLWFFSKKLCLHCNDHLGKHSDISVGDIYTPEFEAESIKHSAVVIRTPDGEKVFSSAKSEGCLIVKDVDPSEIIRSQKRIVIPSDDMRSRALAASLLKVPYKEHTDSSFRFRSFLTYLLLFFNSKITDSSFGRRFLYYIPLPLLFAEVVIIKAINTTLKPQKDKKHYL